jgi:hypothetical protein
MLAKHNAKGCNRPYRQPRGGGGIPVGAAEASADAPVGGSAPQPSPSSPAAAERAEPTDVTGTTVVEEPAAKRVKFADADTSAEQEDTGSADAAAIAKAPEQQMRAALSDVFAPFLASLDLAEMAAAELLRNERAHWEARAQELASAHADELRRVREECDVSMTALSAELVEARHQLVGPREDQAKVEELQTQLVRLNALRGCLRTRVAY